MGHGVPRLHTVFTPLSEELPRLHPVFRLPPAHTSIPSCGRTRIPSCGRARVHACHKKPGRRPNRSAEGWSEARRAKRPIYCLCFYFLHLRPKNACQAPKFPNPLPTNNIRLSYELPSNRYTGYRSKNNRKLTRLRAQLIENTHFSHNPFVMKILQMQNACNQLNTSSLS
jgi:hypothetical protein